MRTENEISEYFLENQMKKIIILALGLLVTGQLIAKESTHDKHTEHSKHSSNKLTLNHGKKWDIDQVMNENMSAIMKENKKVATLTSAKKATKEDYNRLSDLIATSAQNIVTKCKLSPQADEVFHSILADLYTVSEHLKDSKTPMHAIEKLDKTLKSYIQYFNHPASN